MNFLIISLVLIFVSIAVLHFLWAFGIKWLSKNTIPTNDKGEPLFNPGKVDCVIVGIGLLFFAFYYFQFLIPPVFNLPAWVYNVIGWIIPSIFLLRAVGEFKYIGFFKKHGNTDFGKLDTRFYSPLCLLIGLIGMLVQMFRMTQG